MGDLKESVIVFKNEFFPDSFILGDNFLNQVVNEWRITNVMGDDIKCELRNFSKSQLEKNVNRQKNFRADAQTKNCRKKSLLKKTKTLSAGTNSFKYVGTQSEENIELKILNTRTASEKFLNICDAFEKLLMEIENPETLGSLYKKLINIKELIEGKISLLKNEFSEFCETLPQNDMYSSARLLSSENSSDQNLYDSSFQMFLIRVYCPFCAEIQNDKISLVKHLHENCVLHLNKTFQLQKDSSYATFQILPNNIIKCNVCIETVGDLKNFYMHLNSQFHLKAYDAATKNKVHKNCLFCSCCKVLIHSSYTQINVHINHEIHKMKAFNKMSSENLRRFGIYCLYTEKKKFKCMGCNSNNTIFDTLQHFLMHFKNIYHKSQGTPYSCALQCEFCSKAVKFSQIKCHLTSSTHAANEKNFKEQNFELCLYCGSACKNLLELSLHMEDKCYEINKIKQEMLMTCQLKEPDTKLSKVTKKNKIGACNFIEESHITNSSRIIEENEIRANSIKEGYWIKVKDNTNVSELLKYFENFGEILSVETHEDKDVAIQFRNKRSVEDILLRQNVIKIGKLKLKLTHGSASELNKKIKENCDESGLSGSTEQSVEKKDLALNTLQFGDLELDELYQRVSSKLINSAHKLDSSEKEKILLDCSSALNIKCCNFVGFSALGLSFYFETANIFCSPGEELNDSCEPLIDLKISGNLLLETFYEKLCKSELWADVVLCSDEDPYPYIKCLHKATQKACTITTISSTILLTRMLGKCIKNNLLVKPFCVTTRFWLSVHELEISECEYALISLLIFFLIRKGILVSPSENKQRFEKETFAISGPENPYSTFKELFKEFLRFTSTFDFDKYAICVSHSVPLPKSFLRGSEFKPLSDIQNPAHLLNTALCILDPILFVNLASSITQKHQVAFLKIIGSSIKNYNFM